VSEKAEGAPGAEPKKAGGGLGEKLPLLLSLLNSVVILATLGLMVYSRILFKRPAITEEAERARLVALHSKPQAPTAPGLIEFPVMTVNILSNPVQPKALPGQPQQIQGKLHYATLAFSLEIRDIEKKEVIEELRPLITDRIIGLVGRKAPNELSTVQGRYVLRAQIIEGANELIEKTKIPPPVSRARKKKLLGPAPPAEPLITNLYFSQVIVQ
jgi:flagellar basal body-associated protein FliL